MPDLDSGLDDDIGDEMLRLIFTACHPLLSREARAALTLRMVCGLTTEEIARAFLMTEATVAQRIVRVKRRCAAAGLAYEPRGQERDRRLPAVLEVVYLVFNEGYCAAAARTGCRRGLWDEAGAPARVLPVLTPRHARRKCTACWRSSDSVRRAAARPVGPGRRAHPADGPGSRRWDPLLIRRGGGAAPHRAPPRAHRSVRPAGRHRRLPRAGAEPRDHRLAQHRRPLRTAFGLDPIAGRRAKSRRRRGDGRGTRRRSGDRGGAGRGPGAEALSPAAERPRRPSPASRPYSRRRARPLSPRPR